MDCRVSNAEMPLVAPSLHYFYREKDILNSTFLFQQARTYRMSPWPKINQGML